MGKLEGILREFAQKTNKKNNATVEELLRLWKRKKVFSSKVVNCLWESNKTDTGGKMDFVRVV